VEIKGSPVITDVWNNKWFLSLIVIVRSKEVHNVSNNFDTGVVGSNPIRNMNVYLCRIVPNAVHITEIIVLQLEQLIMNWNRVEG
jgi:hypothetical protein